MKMVKNLQKTLVIFNCQTHFYNDLYKEVNSEKDIPIQSKLCKNENKLSDKDSQELED